jgi:hypothetical protein
MTNQIVAFRCFQIERKNGVGHLRFIIFGLNKKKEIIFPAIHTNKVWSEELDIIWTDSIFLEIKDMNIFVDNEDINSLLKEYFPCFNYEKNKKNIEVFKKRHNILI